MIRKLSQKAENRLAFSQYLFLILTIFTCTFFVYRDFQIRMALGYGILGLLLVLCLFCRLSDGRLMEMTPVKWLFAALCGSVLLSYLLPNANRDDDTTSYIVAMVICCGYVVAARPTERETGKILKILLAVAAVMAAYVIFFVIFEELYWRTLYQIVSPTQQDYLSYYVPRGYAITVGGCTYTDYILLLGIAACCGLWLTKKEWDREKIALTVAVGIFCVAIFLVGRRGELLGTAAVLVLLFLLTGKKKQRHVRLAVLAGTAVAGVALLVLLWPWLKNADFLHRYVMTVENLLAGKDISSGRLELYEIAWDLFRDAPLLGNGLAQFTNNIPDAFRELHGADVRDAHCIYLQFLCENGIVGTALRLIPMGLLYARTLRQFLRLQDGGEQANATAVQANAASFVIQSFLLILGIFDPCFTRIIFWCFYGIAVLLLTVALSAEGAKNPKKRWI